MNRCLAPLLSVPLILCYAATAHAQATAEQEDGPDWYRVELLIFANRDPAALLSETWPLLPELNYPERQQRILQQPNQAPAQRPFELQEFDQLRTEPVFDLAWDTPIEQLLRDYQQRQLPRRPDIQLEPLFELNVPVAFTQLPDSDSEFSSQRRRLNRAGDIEVLLHQSWLQPILSREASTPLLVDGKPVRGDFPELQGSILLYSARYLHLETTLWLNTDGSYLDTAWSMPLPPLPPAEAMDQPMAVFALAPSPQWLELPASPASDEALPDDLLEPEIVEPEMTPVEAEPAPGPVLSEEMLAAWLATPEYGYRHAVIMQQRRRMRSGELHYLDHPLLGLLIKVSRYPFEPFVDNSAQPLQTDVE